MSAFAAGTGVPVDRSKAEIEKILGRYGATEFLYGATLSEAVIGFRVRDRAVKMRLVMPSPLLFEKSANGRPRTREAARKLLEGEIRRRWRALTLVIKAKLEAVESNIATFDDEWLAYMVLPGGETVGERLAPQLAEGFKGPLMLGMDK